MLSSPYPNRLKGSSSSGSIRFRALPQSEVELTHLDLNDSTLEGMRHRNLPLFSVQYHPEASPGPHDSHYLFKDFVKMMEEWKSSGQ